MRCSTSCPHANDFNDLMVLSFMGTIAGIPRIHRSPRKCPLPPCYFATLPPWRFASFEDFASSARLYVRMHVMLGDPEQLLLQDAYDHGQLARCLFERYYAPLHYLAYSILGDSAAADDIVQDTLLIALDKIDQYQPGSDLKAWLCRIAIYRCRDVLRWRKTREKWYAVWTRVALLGTPPHTPERQAEDDELRGELWQAVDRLSEKHRLPVLLFYVFNLSAPEIAQILNIPEGTVYSRLHYACRQLAGQFAHTDLEAWAEELCNE